MSTSVAQNPASKLGGRLKADLDKVIKKELGDNPKLVGEIEAIFERLTKVAGDDLLGLVRNPALRALLEAAFHEAVTKAFQALPK